MLFRSATARCDDVIVAGLATEQGPDAMECDLVLDQPLGRFLERLLHLTNADDTEPFASDRRVNDFLGEEMRLAGATATVGSLVSLRCEEWSERPRRLDFEDQRWSA